MGDTAPAAGRPTTALSDEDKLAEAIRRSEKYMSPAVWTQVKQLLTPDSLRLMAAVTGVWAISHFMGAGEIADIVLLIVGGVVAGMSAVDVGRELLAFARPTYSAQSEEQLDQAAKNFANAVAIGGITLIAGIVFKSRPKAFREPFFAGPVHVPKVPKGPGFRYKPTESLGHLPSPPGKIVFGTTDMFGNIIVDIKLSPAQIQETLFHERVHKFLTPKFYFLREIRIKLAIEGYNKSYLLRYLEEALAQTYALVRTQGGGAILEGLAFPVKNGYVSIGSMAKEAGSIVLGTVNVSGNSYRVAVNLNDR